MRPSTAVVLALSAVGSVSAAPGLFESGEAHGSHRSDDGNKASWRDHIKNVVVLVQENRSFDTFAGGLTYSNDIDGLNGKQQYCNPVNTTDPSAGQVCAEPTAQNIAPEDPPHGIAGVNFQILETYHPDEGAVDQSKVPETMHGFVTEQQSAHGFAGNVTRAAEVINYYTPDHIPVFNAMASNYVLFDRWFADVPGPTNPNRAYLTSGTSYGHGKNDEAFMNSTMPQRSIFQQMTEKNITWINYHNVTGYLPDAQFYEWSVTSGTAQTNVKHLADFFADAKAGTLPQFTYINPECCSWDSFHPPSSMTNGEKFLKLIYEAVRNGPQWNETLFVLTFDEHGGFADHVPPPVNVPNPDGLTYTDVAPDGQQYTFDFKRLGVRVPTVVMSPWVDKGVIEHKGHNGDGKEYTHSSLPAFLAKLWDLDNLTPRTAYASTFEHLIKDKFRDDTPAQLPEPVEF